MAITAKIADVLLVIGLHGTYCHTRDKLISPLTLTKSYRIASLYRLAGVVYHVGSGRPHSQVDASFVVNINSIIVVPYFVKRLTVLLLLIITTSRWRVSRLK